MKKFNFTPNDGYLSKSSFPNPTNENETREQIQSLHNQTRDFINDTLVRNLNSSQGAKEIGTEAVDGLTLNGVLATNVDEQLKALMDIKATSEGFKKVRIGPEKQLQYSNDGTDWHNASDGVLLYDGVGMEMPPRKKVVVENAKLLDKGDRIVVIAPRGEKGEPGAPGKDGINGTSFIIKGSFTSLELLQQAHPTANSGDAYSVGNGIDNVVYVWNSFDSKWDNIGAINGPAGVGMPTGGKAGQLLVKKSDSDFDFEYVDLNTSTNVEILTITIQPEEWINGIYTFRHHKITAISEQEIIPPIYYDSPESKLMKRTTILAELCDRGQINGEAYFGCDGIVPKTPIILRVILRG